MAATPPLQKLDYVLVDCGSALIALALFARPARPAARISEGHA